MKIKSVLRFFVSIFAFLLSICSFAQLPSVKIDNLKGEQINTNSLLDDGKPMIISFWACTCKPCIQELDSINENLPDWLEEADFKVVAVSTDDARFSAKARSLAQGHGWEDFVQLYDKNQDFMRAMNVSVTPQVFVLDGKGNIVYSHTGYVPGSELELLDAIKGIE
ncbi:MAG: TlpA family protein disulfide reductase [Candidatus Cryptobacteroides sp.]